MSMSESNGEPQPHGARILVVEDEPLIRFGIAEALRDVGAYVVEAASADEAWDYLSSGEMVDVVFTDHRMPGSMTGRQLASRIARQYPAIKVILTSAYLDDREWTAPVLAKPYAVNQTAEALVRLARRCAGPS